ncbi:serine--tRNA ligase [Rickettsiales bacterium (ex Bugula neritina AB1)]|nr:serine--tRNA ligase [Rickettsiales bacterium (ex Bugula neritina AB1)]
MISRKILIENFSNILEGLKKRNKYIDNIEKLPIYLNNLQNITTEIEKLQKNKNLLTKDQKNKKQVIVINQELKQLKKDYEKFNNLAKVIEIEIPNLLIKDVPVGKDANYNVEVIKKSKEYKHNIPHYNMNLVSSAASIVTSRFIYLQGKIASLERALGNFLINFLVNEKNFIEISVPLILSENSLIKTGHIPKEKDNMFKIEDKDLYLIPTSECSILNVLSNNLFKEEELPKKFTAFSQNFRKEAGASGKDLKGLMRLHQFQKVEMIYLTKDEVASLDSLEEMKKNCCNVLDLLGLEYRIILLCSGDTGHTAKITYDVELWMPGMKKYIEISSLSYTGVFQSSELQIKYQLSNKNKKFCEVLNGTFFGLGRLLAGILETYYDEKNNSINIPSVLKKYLNFEKIFLK